MPGERIESAGELKHADDWGVRKMAYEIQQRNEADYRFYRFLAESPVLADLDHTLKITDDVLRFRIFNVDSGDPGDRPAPRDAADARGQRPARVARPRARAPRGAKRRRGRPPRRRRPRAAALSPPPLRAAPAAEVHGRSGTRRARPAPQTPSRARGSGAGDRAAGRGRDRAARARSGH